MNELTITIDDDASYIGIWEVKETIGTKPGLRMFLQLPSSAAGDSHFTRLSDGYAHLETRENRPLMRRQMNETSLIQFESLQPGGGSKEVIAFNHVPSTDAFFNAPRLKQGSPPEGSIQTLRTEVEELFFTVTHSIDKVNATVKAHSPTDLTKFTYLDIHMCRTALFPGINIVVAVIGRRR